MSTFEFKWVLVGLEMGLRSSTVQFLNSARPNCLPDPDPALCLHLSQFVESIKQVDKAKQ